MLLIDAGNSRVKSGLFDGESITSLSPVATRTERAPADWENIDSPSTVLVSNVAGDEVAQKIRRWVHAMWSLEPTFTQVRREAAKVVTQYDDPSQLGVDRWLAALAGYQLAPAAAGVIDAGTAMTVDIVDASGVHLGGSISPGLSLMVDSLTRNTAQLSLESIAISGHVATNTAAAISIGCADAVAGGIELMRQKANALLGAEPTWIITGGAATQVLKLCEFELQHEPNLVLHGLALAEGATC